MIDWTILFPQLKGANTLGVKFTVAETYPNTRTPLAGESLLNIRIMKNPDGSIITEPTKMSSEFLLELSRRKPREVFDLPAVKGGVTLRRRHFLLLNRQIIPR